MKTDPRSIDPMLDRPPADWRAVLFYGPDSGLVAERAARVLKAIVPDNDPFRRIELNAGAVAGDGAILTDEASAFSFGGGRRVLRIADGGDKLAPALRDFLASTPSDSLLVIEAGELGPSSALRKLAEEAPAFASVPCYVEEGSALAQSLSRGLSAEGLTVSQDGLAWLTDVLAGDRLMQRRAIEQLALYMGGSGRLELADLRACLADAASVALDDLSLAVADGDIGESQLALARLQAENTAVVACLRAVQRHFLRLQGAAVKIAAGAPPDGALAALKPPVFFRDKPRYLSQLKFWTPPRIAAALDRLLETEIMAKTTGLPDETVAARCFMELAARGRARG